MERAECARVRYPGPSDRHGPPSPRTSSTSKGYLRVPSVSPAAAAAAAAAAARVSPHTTALLPIPPVRRGWEAAEAGIVVASD